LIGAAKTAPDSVKVAARMQAERVLAQIKGGANFEMLAQQYSVDQSSAQRGGDLGPFKSGMMMKPFDNAVFGMKGTGLVPGIVETDYGYHIIKVTEAKTNTAYKLAAINRSIAPSQATIDDVFRKSDAFAASNTTKAAFDASLKKDKSLIMLRADRIVEGATGFSTLRSAREIVRWAFNSDRNIGDVSEVFQIDNQCIIATLTGETDKDKVTIEDFRDQLTAKVRAELKAEQILKKMSGLSGTLEQIAQKYGAGALVETANDITLTSGVLTSAGADPTALGKAFGQKIGQKSKPFKGEAGVFMMETVSAVPAPALADLSAYKNTARMAAAQNVSFLINQAIKDNAKISDNRARFY
jgi:peptidyl-prolyl cis-trans isomerase D